MADEGMPIRRHEAERAALLSAIVPGLGQWWSGARRRAAVWAVPVMLLALPAVGVLLWAGERGASGLFGVLLRPIWLWAIVIANAAVALLRAGSIADAWMRSRRAPSPATWAMRGLVLVVSGALLVPHLVVHSYAVEALALLDDVFVSEPVASLEEREADLLAQGFSEDDLGPTTSSTTTSSTTTTTRPAPIDPASLVVPGLDPLPEAVGPLGTRYTVLLAGGDFGPGRHDLRTDVMIVASLDMVTGTAVLIGISRELNEVPLPAPWGDSNTMIDVQEWDEDQEYADLMAEAVAAGHEPPPQEREPFCYCFRDRINYLHVLTANWVRTFPDAPDPGMEALRQTIQLLLGIPIDAYVLVDFAGFVDLVDALGGVQITVDRSLDAGFSPAREGEDPVTIDVDPGVHLLDGHQALAYVRDRTGTSDSERMRRQRCLVRELAGSATTGTLLRRFPEISRAIRTSTTTTLPLDLLPAILDALGDLDEGDIATLAIGHPRFTEEDLNYRDLPIIDVEKTRRGVANLLAGVAEGTTLGQAEECP